MRRAAAIILLLMAPLALRAQTLTATPDRTTLMTGERLTLRLVLEGPQVQYQGPFSVPSLEPQLKLLSTEGPQTQHSFQFINGKMQNSGSVTMLYLFEARVPGPITIPAIQYRVAGNLIASAPVAVVISEAPAAADLPGDSAWVPPRDPYIEVKLDKTRAYVGEQITASWHLYNREQFQDLKVYKMPTAGDFTIADLGMVSKLNPQNKLIGNQRWMVSYLMSNAIFPNKAGELTLDSLGLTYFHASNQRDFFGNMMMLRDDVDSDPIRVTVIPLPDEGKPADFSGAVGDFTIALDKTEAALTAGEQLKFTLTVTGDGHPDFVPKPGADLPPGFEIYTEGADKEIRNEKGRAVGVRSFKMIIVPKAAGDYEIGPFSFSAFDPKAHEYKKVESQKLKLTVADNPDLATTDPTLAPDDITAAGQDLRFIKLEPIAASAATGLGLSKALIALQFAPLAAVAAALIIRRRRDRLAGDQAYARRLRAGKASRKHLKEAARARAAGDAATVYARAHQAVIAYIADRMNRPEAGMTTADAVALLRDAKMPDDKIASAEAVLSRCDQARYAQGSVRDQDLGELLTQAEQIIRELARENGA